jgi:Na+-transporting NADH:ubiquinone oxidoreductase subunit D
VFVQVLGICSTLAVTNVVTNTVVMCLGLIWATAMSNISVSVLRRWIPARARMIVETLIIAVWVIIVDIVLRAYLPDISRTLGPYVGLIITNCIVMGRTEAYGLSHPPGLSFIDRVSAGLGYSYVLLIIAVIRELTWSPVPCWASSSWALVDQLVDLRHALGPSSCWPPLSGW